MSVENSEVIDLISINKDNVVVLSISDHLDWNVKNHLDLLETKLNAYINVIETESIYELYPNSVGKEFSIRIAFKYKLNKEAEEFLNSVSEIFKPLPYHFFYYTL